MTRDEIIKLAREAGLAALLRDTQKTHEALERFAALVAAAEREACAKVCTEIMDDFWTGDDRWEAARHCAESIRARSQQ